VWIPYTIHCIDEAGTAQFVSAMAKGIRTFFLEKTPPLRPFIYPALHLNLFGDLGAGKTTAVRFLLKELGYQGKVKSPTYSLCEEHLLTLIADCASHPNPQQQTVNLFHFDFYRMQSPNEWLDAGLKEHFTRTDRPTICIVEWPEKAENTLPTMDIDITIAHASEPQNERARTIDLRANTKVGEQLIAHLKAYLPHFQS